MKITYDPEKNQSNKEKHGVYLSDAVDLDWDTVIAQSDIRRNYGEDRKTALGFVGNGIFNVVYVDRDDERRIISFRKANKREVKFYVANS